MIYEEQGWGVLDPPFQRSPSSKTTTKIYTCRWFGGGMLPNPLYQTLHQALPIVAPLHKVRLSGKPGKQLNTCKP